MKRYRNFKRKRKERKGLGIRRTVYANAPEKNRGIKYPSNYISTTHYYIFTFFPLNFWKQQYRVGNFAFVCIAILSLLPFIENEFPFFASRIGYNFIVFSRNRGFNNGYSEIHT